MNDMAFLVLVGVSADNPFQRWMDGWVDGWINGRKERKEGIGIGIRREGYISVGSSC